MISLVRNNICVALKKSSLKMHIGKPVYFYVKTYNYLITLKCLNVGTPKSIYFPFVPNGKFMVLGFPAFKHIFVFSFAETS